MCSARITRSLCSSCLSVLLSRVVATIVKRLSLSLSFAQQYALPVASSYFLSLIIIIIASKDLFYTTSTSPRRLGTAPRCPCFVRDISRKAPSVPRTGSFSRRRLHHHWMMMMMLLLRCSARRIRTRSFSVPGWNPSLGGRCLNLRPTSSLGQASTPRRRARNLLLLFVSSMVGARRNCAQSEPCGRNLHRRLVFCPF